MRIFAEINNVVFKEIRHVRQRGNQYVGQITDIRCDKCGYHTVLKTGHDLSDSDINVVSEYFDAFNKARINNALSDSKGKPFFLFDRKIALCKAKNELTSLPVFSLIENGAHRVVALQCDCGGEHIIYDDGKESGCVCPKCGGKLTLNIKEFTD